MPVRSRAMLTSGSFRLPLFIILAILVYGVLRALALDSAALAVILITTGLGSLPLLRDSLQSVLRGQFALDYIAILAVLVALTTGEYLVAAIIALMVASGRALEDFGVSQAKRSLTGLIERIPHDVLLWEDGQPGRRMTIAAIGVGQDIFIRKGEVVPLDGVLQSAAGLTDESSLTGEPYMLEKIQGDQIRSGTINVGGPIVVRVTHVEADSTYRKIIGMVQQAQEEKAPLVRLADRYSTWFTGLTFGITAFAYLYSGQDLTRVLAVLVIATPCPLILATPVALMGGVNAAARRRIIVKRLAALETLARVHAVIFDKTGTITLGRPELTELISETPEYSQRELLAIAEALERNSLHPLAKAVVTAARGQGVLTLRAEDVDERIGSGVEGTINSRRYRLAKPKDGTGMAVELQESGRRIAVFRFEDQLKADTLTVVNTLRQEGMDLYIFTGDRREAAEKVAAALGGRVTVRAECSPEEKKLGIEALRAEGKTTAMVGDGINDAPALAYADVGMVFSNDEQTAASEAADVVFLGGEFSLVAEALVISRRTVRIAVQSILWGIGLSVAGMVLAALGYIPPIVGAGLQEVIDVAVILNALRASR